MNPVVLNLEPIARLTDEQFYQLCIANRDLSLEMSAEGELIIVIAHCSLITAHCSLFITH